MRKTLQTFGMSLALMALVILALGLPPANAMTAAEIDVDVQQA